MTPDYSHYRHQDDKELLHFFLELFPARDAQYQVRHEQVLLALKINRAFREDSVAFFEAGTGVGKSLAYLVPAAIQVKRHQKKFVIATATTTLQQQLYQKDMPFTQKLCQIDIKTCLFKGKSHYLCQKCVERDFSSETLDLFAHLRQDYHSDDSTKSLVAEWAAQTSTGDREELARLLSVKNFSQLWSKIHTQDYICGGKNCAARNSEGCFFKRNKALARESDIVITNYSLLTLHLQDTNEDEEGFFDPSARIVCDEAHRLSAMSSSVLSQTYSRGDFIRQTDMVFGSTRLSRFRRVFSNSESTHFEKAYESIQRVQEHLYQCAKLFSKRVTNKRKSEEVQVLWDPEIAESVRLLQIDLAEVNKYLSACLDAKQPISDELLKIVQNSLALVRKYQAYFLDMRSEIDDQGLSFCNWCGVLPTGEVAWNRTAIDLSVFLRNRLFDEERAVVCTSASLLFKESALFLEKQLGVGDMDYEHTQVPSSFDYKSRVFFGVCKGIVEPSHPSYETQVTAFLYSCLSDISGSSLVLCTSYAMVTKITQYLRSRLPKLELLSQGSTETPQSLAYSFSKSKKGVLIATSSFWEGFDSMSAHLRYLIIPRIPFPYPDDLIFEKRCKILESQGFNSFAHLSLPIATLRLKQGFGRLMRNQEDGGVVMLLDTRIMTKFYGNTLLEHLPITSPVYEKQDELLSQMRAHLTAL